MYRATILIYHHSELFEGETYYTPFVYKEDFARIADIFEVYTPDMVLAIEDLGD